MLIRGEDSALDLPSTLTEEEKWHYDLFGYLVLRQVVSPAEVEQMLEIANRWFAHPEAVPEPVNVTQDEYSGVLNNVQYGDRLFERLSLNEKALRIVMGLMWNRPRLFNCALVLQKQRPIREGEKERLHRDTSGFDFPDGFYNPHNDYQAGNGQIYSNYVNTAITLVDVPKDNGFMCIPGTHKSQIKLPTTLDIDNALAPAITFELKAGDCLIFSSRLMHGAKFWKVDYPRRVVFNRYQFSFYFNENYNLPIEAHRHCISDDQYALESVQRSEKGFAKRILERMEGERHYANAGRKMVFRSARLFCGPKRRTESGC